MRNLLNLSRSRLIAPLLISGALASIAGLASPPARADDAAPSDPVVAKVDGKTYHRSDLVLILRDLAQDNPRLKGATVDDPRLYPALVQQLVTGSLVVADAEKQKLDHDKVFKQRLAQVEAHDRSALLQGVYANAIYKQSATEDAEKSLYQQLVSANQVPMEVHVRQIRLGSQADAEAVIAQLDKGADFKTLAHTKGLDTNSNDGELPWFTADNFIPEIAQAAFALKKGEYTKTPVQTNFGWHVLLLMDTRPAPFDDIKDRLGEALTREAIQNKVKALRAKAKIAEYNLDGTPMQDQ